MSIAIKLHLRLIYQLQLQLLLVACNHYRTRNTVFCVTARRHWYIYCTKLNITVHAGTGTFIALN